MTNIAALLVCCLMILPAFGQTAQSDVRGARLGMSLSEVKASESAKPAAEKDDQLTYGNVTLAEVPGELIYQFEDNQLMAATYRFPPSLSSKQAYTDRYNKLKAYLTTQYGAPANDNTNPSTKKGPVDHHSAIWRKDGKMVMVMLDNQEGKAFTTVLVSRM